MVSASFKINRENENLPKKLHLVVCDSSYMSHNSKSLSDYGTLFSNQPPFIHWPNLGSFNFGKDFVKSDNKYIKKVMCFKKHLDQQASVVTCFKYLKLKIEPEVLYLVMLHSIFIKPYQFLAG